MTNVPRRARLTKRFAESLPTPEVEIVCWDRELPGFGIRLLPSGSKSYILQRKLKSGRSIRLKIGATNEISCELARDEARKLIAVITTGGDPAADRRAARAAERQRRQAPLVLDLAMSWQLDRRPHWRSASAVEIERQVRRTILPALGRVKAGELRQHQVKALHGSLPTTMANRTVSTIRSMYSWALKNAAEWPSIHDNPAAKIAMNQEERRERYPQNGELGRLVTVLHGRQDLAAKFYLFLLLTGARRGEAETLRWTDVDLSTGTWTKPAGLTKQRKTHMLPLAAEAVELLRAIKAERPFGGPFAGLDDWPLRRAWSEILAEARVDALRVHDLRHWHASLLVGMGLSLPIVGRLLGHSNPATTNRYAHIPDEVLRDVVGRLGQVILLPKREG